MFWCHAGDYFSLSGSDGRGITIAGQMSEFGNEVGVDGLYLKLSAHM